MIFGLTLILLGLLAVPSLVLAKKPDAQQYFDKLAPYQGWMGLVFAFWGVWGLISCVLNMNLIGHYPIYWITWVAVSLVEAALGFILGYALIVKYVLSKNEAAAKKGEELLAKLVPMQGKIGIVAICLGIWQILASILFYV